MWEFLTAPPNLPFALSFGLLLVFFSLQLIGMLAGSELFAWMDALTPDLPDLDVDLDIDASAVASGGFVDHLFAILNLGRVPLIISLIIFLFFFGAIGYLGQSVLAQMGMPMLPLVAATPISFALTLPFVRWTNAGLARIMPKDENEAVSEETFIGRVATITIGTVTSERQSEARLTGPLGRAHYLQVVADNDGVEFHQGDEVLVVGRRGSLFTIIAATHPQLHD